MLQTGWVGLSVCGLYFCIIAVPRCWRQTQRYCTTPIYLHTFSNLYRLSYRRQRSNGLHGSKRCAMCSLWPYSSVITETQEVWQVNKAILIKTNFQSSSKQNDAATLLRCKASSVRLGLRAQNWRLRPKMTGVLTGQGCLSLLAGQESLFIRKKLKVGRATAEWTVQPNVRQ